MQEIVCPFLPLTILNMYILILVLWKGGGGGQGNNKQQQQEERMKQMEDMKNSILSQVLDQEAR